MLQYGTLTLNLLIDSAQIALGALMYILVAARFIKEALQMYKATKRFELNHYTILFMRESMIYFLVYVFISSFPPQGS